MAMMKTTGCRTGVAAIAAFLAAGGIVIPVYAQVVSGHPAAPVATMAHVLPFCRTAQLRATISLQGGAGSVFTTLVLRNTARGACVIVGYPGASLLDRSGRQIGHPATWVRGIVVRQIVLRPGAAASTMIRSLNPGVGTSNCLPPSTWLRIYPPNERTPLYIRARLSECLGVLEVKPFVAGTLGVA